VFFCLGWLALVLADHPCLPSLPTVVMSLAQRVLLTWVFTLVFLIMLVVKLDGKVTGPPFVCAKYLDLSWQE